MLGDFIENLVGNVCAKGRLLEPLLVCRSEPLRLHGSGLLHCRSHCRESGMPPENVRRLLKDKDQ